MRWSWTRLASPWWDPLAIVALALLGGATGWWVGDRYGGPDATLAMTTMGAGAGLAIGLGFGLKTGLLSAVVLGFGFIAAITLKDIATDGLLQHGYRDGYREILAMVIFTGGYSALAIAVGVLVGTGLRWLNAAVSRLRPRRRPA